MAPLETSSYDTPRAPRGPVALTVLGVLALTLFIGFILLGNWQVQRLAWKRALIARVDSRVHAPPVAPPTRSQWPAVTAEKDEYLHVALSGSFLHDRQTLIWTATDEGSGYWVMTPLRLADGSIVLVNRGFAPADWCGRDGHCAPGTTGEVTVTGLLRVSEPSGLLRHNDPAHNTWYTRDVVGIAAARGLHDVAPYFVDADVSPAGGGRWPEGGKTVISFPNNHLSYLITWYLLALMVLGASLYVGYDEYRLRRNRI
ncbi:SURF1 family protein [Dyella flagellata]|uniref:SURF1-like protein n=1 Tax=Dyella flagellata TaxID=1867833 RepID=A0ABQ5X9X4_9GAMM|nr:SURF1 family protein [Dyella flagellata]GLQ88062.1 SURF1-like protein [Dyella flagellata]